MEVVPGKKYRGHGWVNEYGEFQFNPEQTGANKGKVRKLCEGDGYAISTTDRVVMVRMTLNRAKGDGVSSLFAQTSETVKTKLEEYEF